jgi:hypothetical protein
MADTGKTSIYNPAGSEKEARDLVYERKRQMEDNENRQRAMKMVQKWRRMWEMQREVKNKDDWQSNHIVPTTLAIVETILSEVIDHSPKPLILPRSSEDAPKATIMEHVFNFTWEVADGDMALYDVLKDAFILGTGIGQEYYWKEPRRIMNNKGKEELITDFDDVYLEAVKFEDFFPDEKGRAFTGPYQLRDCIRRYIMNYDDFKLFFQGEVWDPLKNAHYVVPGGDTEYHEDQKPPDGFDKGKDVEVLWYWSRKPLDALYIVANNVLIVKGPNPFKHKQLPFARAVDVKRPHDFYGKGEPELLESIVDEANTLRQMIIDRNHLDIDKMFFVSPNMNLSDEDLIARPHGAIPSDDVNSAKPIEYGDIPRSIELSLKHLEDDSVIATGINPRAQALPSSGTATEAAIIKESTLKRIRLKMRLIEKEFLTTVGRLRVSNILQYYSQPKLEKIVGEKETEEFKQQMGEMEKKGEIVNQGGEKFKKTFRQIRIPDKEITFDAKGVPTQQAYQGVSFFDLKPEYFMPVARGGYDIKFEAGSTLAVSKALLKSELSEMYDRLSQVAMAVPNSYDIIKLGDALLRANDLNPADFKTQQKEDDNQRLGILLDMAAQENQQMMQGKPVPATPYSSPAHTQVHVEFTKSEAFQQLKPNNPIIDIFTNHITGEVMAQQQRSGGGGMASGDTSAQLGGPTAPGGTPAAMGGIGQPAPQAAAPGGVNRGLQAANPAQNQGGGQVARG